MLVILCLLISIHKSKPNSHYLHVFHFTCIARKALIYISLVYLMHIYVCYILDSIMDNGAKGIKDSAFFFCIFLDKMKYVMKKIQKEREREVVKEMYEKVSSIVYFSFVFCNIQTNNILKLSRFILIWMYVFEELFVFGNVFYENYFV